MGVTVSELSALAPGDRLRDGAGLFFRRNNDLSFTAWLRVGGRDARVHRFAHPASKTDINRTRALAAGLKTGSPASTEAPAGEAFGSDKLTPASPLGDVWDDMLLEIDRNRKWTPRNRHTNVLRIQKHVQPSTLWSAPVGRIDVQDVLATIRPIAVRAPDQADKVKGLLRLAFSHAMALGLCASNPVTSVAMLKATAKASAPKHFPAIIDIVELRTIVKTIRSMDGLASVRNAALIQAFCVLRSSEVAGGRWDEVEFHEHGARWRVARARMKIKDPSRADHVLDLPHPVAELLKSMHRADSEWMFPNRAGTGHIAAGALDAAYRRQLGLAGRHVPHSWRAALRSNAVAAVGPDDSPKFGDRAIETALDHAPPDQMVRAYTRGVDAAGCARLLEWWAGELLAEVK